MAAPGDRLAIAATAIGGDCIWNLSQFTTDYRYGTNFYSNRWIPSWTPSPPAVVMVFLGFPLPVPPPPGTKARQEESAPEHLGGRARTTAA